VSTFVVVKGELTGGYMLQLAARDGGTCVLRGFAAANLAAAIRIQHNFL
jgi:hypothetical protein